MPNYVNLRNLGNSVQVVSPTKIDRDMIEFFRNIEFRQSVTDTPVCERSKIGLRSVMDVV